jgi:hypothetical protein
VSEFGKGFQGFVQQLDLECLIDSVELVTAVLEEADLRTHHAEPFALEYLELVQVH